MADNHNFLFVSLDGLIGDIAWRVQQEGHAVKYAITADEYSQDVADGIVPKVDDWEAHLGWADIVVFDDGFGLGTHAERLRAEGIPAIGGTRLTDRLESERGFGHAAMADLGLNVIESVVFEEFQDGIDFVRENPDAYVIKPDGEAQNFNQLLYVGQSDDGEDVIQMLDRYRRWIDADIDAFQLQKRKDGIEMSVCGFFDGRRFLDPVNYTFEHKRLFPDELGPMTGEMGTSMFWGPPNDLFEETVGRFEPVLRDEGYIGPIDINCIVTKDAVFPLEVTPRFGYPQIQIQEAAMAVPIGEFLFDLAADGDPALRVHDGYQIGFRVCVPPFPADDVGWFDEHSRDLVVRFRTEDIPPGIHLEDMKYTAGEYRVAGETGEVLVVTGKGPTMRAAQVEAYDRAEDIILPNKFYRDDIGDRWYTDAKQLRSWGYLRDNEQRDRRATRRRISR